MFSWNLQTLIGVTRAVCSYSKLILRVWLSLPRMNLFMNKILLKSEWKAIPLKVDQPNDVGNVWGRLLFLAMSLVMYGIMKSVVSQGPAVQSVVSLTSSLRVISLTVLADSIHNILIFFTEKMWVAFAMQKLLTFFQQKISAYLRITRCKF